MEFLKNNRRFSFKLNGKEIAPTDYTLEVSENGTQLISTYTFFDGLKVTNIAKKYAGYDAYEWVNYFENTSSENSGIISELYDADIECSLGGIKKRERTPWLPTPDELLKVYNPRGSIWANEEFSSQTGELRENSFINCLYSGDVKSYAARGGRSSGGVNAPFFNVQNGERGFIAAIGWTGQWNAKISANDSSVSFKSKIEDTEFFLLPGEKIRTSSFVIMNYTGDLEAAQNKWRRFIRAEISIITKRGGKGPLCAGIWGGMTSEQVISRIDTLTNNSIPMEYMWMDAGWYGEDTQPTLSEYEGDWSQHTGDWTISPYIHKNRLVDVSEMIHKSGRRFILWFEPERICKRAPIVKQHPEYLLHNPARSDMLLNLGDENAFEYIKEQISSVIARVGVDFYRQDFNFEPLPYWRGADTEGRRGITEIKHITGLYRLWDYLLDRFPTLLIDNCASGGRRLDIETLKRSMPLWRSDAQCPANPIPEMTQMHTMNFAQWMPYHGSGTGRCYDTYNFRSAYAPSMTTNYTFSAADSFGDDEKKLEWLRKMANEYLTVREYFLGDVYHVTKPDISPYAWNIAQWNRPESFDGMIQVFKHESSVYPEAAFKLRALDEGKTYVIRDLDGGEQTATGKALMEEGIRVEIKETRVAKIYIYSALN